MKGNEPMNEEINNIVTRLNTIQKKVFDYSLTSADRREFKELTRKLGTLGYRASKRRVRDTFGRLIAVVWSAKSIEQSRKDGRNTECEFIFTDVRPKNRRTLKGDCTTRAMAYCLNGQMTYDEIESRQYVLAAQRHTRRNTNGTWDIILTEHDYAKINLWRSVKRSVLARMLAKVITRPVVSHSSGHVAVIDKDGVHDTWDSRGGRCDALHVYKTDVVVVRECLKSRGIDSGISTILCMK
jgi:hypothetical protein